MSEMQTLTEKLEPGQNFMMAGVQFEIHRVDPLIGDEFVQITAAADLSGDMAVIITLPVGVGYGFELVPPRNLPKEVV